MTTIEIIIYVVVITFGMPLFAYSMHVIGGRGRSDGGGGCGGGGGGGGD